MAGSNQNQGLQIAVIIFVILTVLSMGFAVFTATERRELVNKFQTQARIATENEQSFGQVQEELNEVKKFMGLAETETSEMPDLEATRAKFQADLKKYGERLKSVQADAAAPANYSQSIDAILTVLETRNLALEAEKLKVAALEKQKSELEGTFQAQVDTFKMQADAADKARAEATTKIQTAETQAQQAKEQVIQVSKTKDEEINTLRATMQKQIDDKAEVIAQLETALKKKDDFINVTIKQSDFAATYDGQVTKVNPLARTVWINVGYYDNLKKHLTFSVQPQGVPPGSKVKPKAKIEVMKILDNHLAECQIVEDDIDNPILVGDNIFTTLWEPGQQTRFAFAGRIDLDGDGSDDIDRVRALVDRAGGRIDGVAKVNGETEGELTIETRYLVLGTVPADKAAADAYDKMLKLAESLGVQRVPVAVFLDQIGYRREDPRTRIVFGGGAAAAPKTPDMKDGEPKVSNGSVNALFQKRRPPAAASGSAY
jgi:hypothetical protein